MRAKFIIFPILLFILTLNADTERGKDIEKEVVKKKIIEGYVRLPLYFIKNEGQIDDRIKYYERGFEHIFFFTTEGIYMTLITPEKGAEEIKVDNIVLRPVGGRSEVEITGEDELHGRVNYFIGNEPTKWRRDIPTYSKVRYSNLYEGIDLVFYGNQRQIEYDVVVRAGVEPSKVAFLIEGARDVSVKEGDELEITLPSGRSIIQRRPYIYQEINGEKIEIGGGYVIEKEGDSYRFTFFINEYNREYALVIDPILIYSTYLGGSAPDHGFDIEVDDSGNIYLTGETFSNDFPIKDSYDSTYNTYGDVFVTKLNSVGNSIIYSTYLGGSDRDDSRGIAVDSSGNAYVTGYTKSNNFPTQNAFDATYNGGDDVFVTKIDSLGRLIYSTYLGGSYTEQGNGIAVDSSGNAYVTGYTNSSNFPTRSAYDSICGTDGNCNYDGGVYGTDVFVTKINQSGNDLVYSTYLGGSNKDFGYGISVDKSGNAYVTGYTESTNFPTQSAYDSGCGTDGNCNFNGSYYHPDVFVTKLNQSGNGLIYSTYLGGSSSDKSFGIAVDSWGNVYITGNTDSSNFPTQNAFDSSYNSNGDIFVTKLNQSGNGLIYSTYLGGSSSDSSYGVAVDSLGYAYITGNTDSSNFPTQNAFDSSYNSNGDIFVTKLNQSGNGLIYSTYLGGSSSDSSYGIAVDNLGNVYITGNTDSNDFPTKNAYQGSKQGSAEAFIVKLGDGYRLTITKAGTGNGTVTSNPSGIDCGSDCVEAYNYDTQITLTATHDSNSIFGGWGNDCSSCGANASCQITMIADKTCLATFNKLQLTLTVKKYGTGNGNINVSGCQISWTGDTGSCTVSNGTTITVSGVADTGSTFDGWSGGTGSASGCTGINDCTFNITQDSSITAVFILNKYTLSIVKSGLGSGVVTSNPEGINCGSDCSEQYDYGTMVTITATPDSGSRFDKWYQDCSICGSNIECKITVSSNLYCEAVFTKDIESDGGMIDVVDTGISDTLVDVSGDSVEDIIVDIGEDIIPDITEVVDVFEDMGVEGDAVVDAVDGAVLDVRDDAIVDVGGDITDVADITNDVIIMTDGSGIDIIYEDGVSVMDISAKEKEDDIYACSCNLIE
ncbi:MAG: SBBP repeat-containing protein [Deltaproteobacteria bacterium]|nr:SBBP repeat-containing protein [Deltaproteobacteria bacterium]